MNLSSGCTGCIAAWGLWNGWLNIRALRETRTGMWLNEVHVHGAIIKAWNNQCGLDWRFGDQVGTFNITKNNGTAWATHDKHYGKGGWTAWGNAGAHRWKLGSTIWQVGQDGGTDICHKY